MFAKFNEQHDVFLTYCTPNIGSFALKTDSGRISHWDNCREQFAAKFVEDMEGFYFSHRENKGYDIANFIHRFEIILKSSRESFQLDHTEFSYTNSPHILYVKTSSFWKECFFKRSLFTIIIRCAHNYDAIINNFDDVLFSSKFKECSYIIETKIAVTRFLFGFTKYTGITPVVGGTSVIKHGWREEFSKLDEPTTRKRLVLPDGITRSTNIVGAESLWT
jgi:hypothetical protein